MLPNFWSDRAVAVTGAGGFIGSALTRELVGLGARIRSVAHDDPDFDTAFVGAEAVFHLAGQTSAYVAEDRPEFDYASNVELLARILPQVAQPETPPLLIHASTATIAGVTQSLPIPLDWPDQPSTTYDRHKLVAEQGLAMFRDAGLIRSVSLRLTNVYGPGPRSSGPGRGLVNQFARQAVLGEPLTLFGQGDYIRDFVFIDDVVAAFLAAAESWSSGFSHAYVVGSGQGRSIREMAESIIAASEELVGRRSELRFLPEPKELLPIDRRHFVAPIRPFVEATQWSPLVPFEIGIRSTVESVLEEEIAR